MSFLRHPMVLGCVRRGGGSKGRRGRFFSLNFEFWIFQIQNLSSKNVTCMTKFLFLLIFERLLESCGKFDSFARHQIATVGGGVGPWHIHTPKSLRFLLCMSPLWPYRSSAYAAHGARFVVLAQLHTPNLGRYFCNSMITTVASHHDITGTWKANDLAEVDGAAVAAATKVIVRQTPSQCGTRSTMDCTSSRKSYVWMRTD